MTVALLDVDGTLVDTNLEHAEAWSRAFQEFGLQFSRQEIFPYIGMGGEKLVEALVSGLDEKENQMIGARHSQIFLSEYAPRVKATAGAYELITTLRARNAQPTIVTSAQKDELEIVLKVAGLSELLASAVTSDDVERSKPDPDLVNAALKKTKTAPGEAVMVGDTPYDIDAAHRAGVQAIALLCGGRSEADLQNADAIFRDPADLRQNLQRAPVLGREH